MSSKRTPQESAPCGAARFLRIVVREAVDGSCLSPFLSRGSSRVVTWGLVRKICLLALRIPRSERQAQQVLNQVALLAARQAQRQAGVVMIDDIRHRSESSIVIKPAF